MYMTCMPLSYQLSCIQSTCYYVKKRLIPEVACYHLCNSFISSYVRCVQTMFLIGVKW